jgi:hypothetical protein
VTSTDVLRFHFDPDGHGQRVEFSSRPRILTVVFATLWFAGWFLLLTLTFLDYVRFGRLSLFFTTLVVFGGLPAALALLWAASGKRESLGVDGGRIRIERRAGPFRLSRTFGVGDVIGIRVANPTAGLFADLAAVRHFYSGGNGQLAFDTRRGVFSWGHDLPQALAIDLIGQVRQIVPVLSQPQIELQPLHSRFAGYLTTFMSVTMLGFAMNVPLRLAMTDRPICFYDEHVSPKYPIDVSALPRKGRIYLVPLDEFPIERAHALGAHFRAAFDLPIDVVSAMAWPDGAYDDGRGQMDTSIMLSHLESSFPERDPRVVVIALSMRDLFNSEVGWSYVFSYRRHNRVAVVSPVRMDRGCLGIVPADESRILSRLKKMVGKNIGIMYFGLPLSRDPGSMLYGSIGGPQELDAMSEQF